MNELEKNIGIVGLGKMGSGFARRLAKRGWSVTGFDPDASARDAVAEDGVAVVESLRELAGTLPLPRLIWIMVPHQLVDEVLADVSRSLDAHDTLIDGGNSFYKEAIRRSEKLARQGVTFIDVGVSGGPKGARDGACLMVGGEQAAYKRLMPLWSDLAAKDGFGHFKGAGAGHFVKMVHNGIEYGMMQSIAEGFNLMRVSGYDLDLQDVARVYRHGSVIVSRLIGWLEEGYGKYGTALEDVSGSVTQSGEGLWTVETARELNQEVTVIERSLQFREESTEKPSYTGKILTMFRSMFGGHDVQP